MFLIFSSCSIHEIGLHLEPDEDRPTISERLIPLRIVAVKVP